MIVSGSDLAIVESFFKVSPSLLMIVLFVVFFSPILCLVFSDVSTLANRLSCYSSSFIRLLFDCSLNDLALARR
jgi:hypothetical protein